LRHNLRVSRSALDYARITPSFFAISSERDGVILYSRCNFSRGARGAIHCFDLKYPQEEKRSWDAVVTRISLSLRPLESRRAAGSFSAISVRGLKHYPPDEDCSRSPL